MSFTLLPIPRWTEAATELVAGLSSLPSAEARLTLLEMVCRGLGEELYPAFLQMLCVIESGGDRDVQQTVSATLVDCLVTGRLPSGRVPAWGSSSSSRNDGFDRMRSLGPIEYLCAWYAQPNNLTPLAQDRFNSVLGSVISLVSTNQQAAQLYIARLTDDIDDTSLGSLSGSTRVGLESLALSWESSMASGEVAGAEIAHAFHDNAGSESVLDSIAYQAPPELLR